jgi:hypothetical protein
MIIQPFKPHHLHELLLQPSQAMMQPTLSIPGYGEGLAAAGPAFTGIHNDEVIACMGLIPQWEGRAVAWGLIGSEAAPHFVGITKAIFKTMKMYPFRRIETAVATNFDQGHRWMGMLGFQNEGTMKSFTPMGDDCDLYARISHEHYN